MKAIVTVGISASGKSTYANSLVDKGWVKIERDIIRRELFNFEQWCDYKFSKVNEQKVTDYANNRIRHAYEIGKNIIISDTNLNERFRDDLVNVLKTIGYDVEVKSFPISLKDAIKRDESRNYSVGRDVIYKQWKQWLEFSGRKKYIPNTGKESVILCDIDGTIAQMVSRTPFKWSKVGEDVPRRVIMSMVEGCAKYYDCGVVLISGRDEICREDTEAWLSG